MDIYLIFIVIIIVVIFFSVYKGFQANKVNWEHPVINCVDGWARIYCRRFHKIQYDSLNIPDSGSVLVVCNHVSGLDPVVLVTACERPMRFMIAIEEYNRPILNYFFRLMGCIPVERTAKPEIAFRQAIKILKEGEVVVIFPHGGIHTDDGGHRPIKKGVLKLAQLTGSSIIPTRVTGIRNAGSSFTPLFLPSAIRLQVFNHLSPNFIDQKDAIKDLGDLLLGKISHIEI
jgi:1-acyl-sn-glycerol-3-phosphate acyltransferase